MKAFILVTALLAHLHSYAQGCSDAGFCTIGNLAPHTKMEGKHILRLSLAAGIGDEDVFVFTPALEYLRQFNSRWSAGAKLTGNYASGSLGTALGAGDVFLSGTYNLPSKNGWQASFTLGTKLPLNQSNLTEGGRSLPMQYQSSLGTVDVIVGAALQSRRWQLAAGWQQPVTGTNGNQFLPQYWPNGTASAYPPSNDFNRKGDVLLRAAYGIVSKEKLHVNVGLLGIYHLGEDSYINANVQNKPIALIGSQGLTLNATTVLQWQVSPKWELGLTAGVPLVVRDVRPDGLTRSFVFAPQISYQF